MLVTARSWLSSVCDSHLPPDGSVAARVTLPTFSKQGGAATNGPGAAALRRAELCPSSVVEDQQKYCGAKHSAAGGDSRLSDATLNVGSTASWRFWADAELCRRALPSEKPLRTCELEPSNLRLEGMEDAGWLLGRDRTLSTAGATLGGCRWGSLPGGRVNWAATWKGSDTDTGNHRRNAEPRVKASPIYWDQTGFTSRL